MKNQYVGDVGDYGKYAMLRFFALKGIEVGAKSETSKDAEKYTLRTEIADYYNRGQNVVYYCHKARRNERQWDEKKNEMLEILPDARILVLTFHRGTQRSYIFVVHPETYESYREHINEFVMQYWKDESGNPSFVFEQCKNQRT